MAHTLALGVDWVEGWTRQASGKSGIGNDSRQKLWRWSLDLHGIPNEDRRWKGTLSIGAHQGAGMGCIGREMQ